MGYILNSRSLREGEGEKERGRGDYHWRLRAEPSLIRLKGRRLDTYKKDNPLRPPPPPLPND